MPLEVPPYHINPTEADLPPNPAPSGYVWIIFPIKYGLGSKAALDQGERRPVNAHALR